MCRGKCYNSATITTAFCADGTAPLRHKGVREDLGKGLGYLHRTFEELLAASNLMKKYPVTLLFLNGSYSIKNKQKKSKKPKIMPPKKKKQISN